jgi:uncharacterized protein
MKESNILLIFARNPVLGNVKTRLAASIGEKAALEVYKELLERTQVMAQKVAGDKMLCYADLIEKRNDLNENFLKAKQVGADLGERMANAFAAAFGQGYKKAVVIGTDCPDLNEAILAEAFEKLNEAAIVIGPAFDGGYYLLGMTRPHLQLFENIKWSTPTVFEATISKCEELGLKWSALPPLHDIDEERDLIHLKTRA